MTKDILRNIKNLDTIPPYSLILANKEGYVTNIIALRQQTWIHRFIFSHGYFWLWCFIQVLFWKYIFKQEVMGIIIPREDKTNSLLDVFNLADLIKTIPLIDTLLSVRPLYLVIPQPKYIGKTLKASIYIQGKGESDFKWVYNIHNES